ncbi:MAG TPA: DUF1801 domain-containing protein [Thermoplasmata archaeon]|nr:DUF1801 domain-containing protein [Thermoplasmata archaeon]
MDEYLARVPADARAALEALRRTALGAAPGATEAIEYAMPVIHRQGLLVGIAAQKRHCAFYVMSPEIVDAHSAELQGFDVGKGCLRFAPSRPLPANLVTRLVRARVAENAAKARAQGLDSGDSLPPRGGPDSDGLQPARPRVIDRPSREGRAAGPWTGRSGLGGRR